MRLSHRVSQQPPKNALRKRNKVARSSAVGSAPRSGRGGRAFESPLLDKKGQGCPFFVEAPLRPRGSYLGFRLERLLLISAFASNDYCLSRHSRSNLRVASSRQKRMNL